MVLPSSIQFVGGPTPGIWCRWSITKRESNPDASAASAIATSRPKRSAGATPGKLKLGTCRPTRTGARIGRTVSVGRGATRRSERAAGLVAPAACADPDEGHPVGPRDRLAGGLRVEAEEGADLDRHLLALDAPVAGPGDHDVDLLLAGVCLVVLVTGRTGRQLEPVDPEGLEPELAADEAHRAARACPFDVVDVPDRVRHRLSSLSPV